MPRRTRGGRAVILAGLAAQVSVATVGAFPWLVLPLSMACYVAAAEASDRAVGKRSEALRWAGTAVAGVGLVVIAPLILRAANRTDIKQDLGLMLIVAQVGQALGWRSLRDVRSALMASFGLLVLSASYAPDVLIGIPLLLGWIAVAAALALLAGLGRVEATRAAAAAVVLGLVAFLLVPANPTQGARLRLAALAAGRGEGSRLPTDAFSASRLDLRRRGSLATTGVLRVPKDSPALWRAISFDDYDGTSWNRQAAGQLLAGPGPSYQVSVAPGPTRTDEAELVGDPQAANGTVWSPGQIVSVEAADVLNPVVDGQGDVELTGGTPRYTVTSVEPVTDALRLRSRRGIDATAPRWRSLPVTLPKRVYDLAKQLNASHVSRYETAGLIAAYLREHATYRLDSPVPLPGEDAVDRFLFVDKTGFCEQFASAEVVLLRALGIPSRLVTGLAYGVDDAGRKLFRVSDLHAWAELWVPGVGWVSSDPTAGSTSAGSAAAVSVRKQLADAVSAALRRLTHVPGGKWTLAGLLVAVGLLVGLLVGRRPPITVVRRPVNAGPALAAFLRLDGRLGGPGGQGRRASESLRELARRLEPGLAGALNVVERECYAPEKPAPQEISAAVAVLDRASSPDPAARRARGGRRGGPGRRARRG